MTSSKARLESQKLLKKFFNAKRRSNPLYSIRALARDLELSASYVSRILKGEKPFPARRFQQISKALGLDDIGQRLLAQAVLEEKASTQAQRMGSAALRSSQSLGTPTGKISRASKKPNFVEYEDLPHVARSLLESPCALALLDLVTCRDFQANESWIAQRLGSTSAQVRVALKLLFDLDLLNESNGTWVKKSKKMRLPTPASNRWVREYHKNSMKRAIDELEKKFSNADFEKRSIASISFAANMNNFNRAKQRLIEAMYEVAEILAEGDCGEVFQLNWQLFPLTQNPASTQSK
jgi:uncharacterized protein (TIGR02147 family)